jgi:hypothetical protein
MFPQQNAIAELQQASMRAQTQLSLAGEPVYQNLSGLSNENTKADNISPQIFLTRPNIEKELDASQILRDWPVLPGRPYGVPDHEASTPITGTY